MYIYYWNAMFRKKFPLHAFFKLYYTFVFLFDIDYVFPIIYFFNLKYPYVKLDKEHSFCYFWYFQNIKQNIQTCAAIYILFRISYYKLSRCYNLNHRSRIYFPLNNLAGADYEYEISFVPLLTLFLFFLFFEGKNNMTSYWSIAAKIIQLLLTDSEYWYAETKWFSVHLLQQT